MNRETSGGPLDVARLGYAAREATEADAGRAGERGPRATRTQRNRAPCSFQQEQLWFVDQLTPGNTAFTFSWPLRLLGRLDVSALEQALGEIVHRHEALRTGFVLDGDRPVQLIDSHGVFHLDRVDLSAESDPTEAARKHVDEETERPFDLEEGGLFRATLFRLSDSEHILQIVVHHIVFDEQSKIILFGELSSLYNAHVAGSSVRLPEPSAQYGDFADWQRSELTEESVEAELAYWVTALSDAPAALELPADHSRPPVASLRGDRLRLPIPQTLTTGLAGLAEKEGVTFFGGLLAAFDLLLARYSGEEDIIVGIPADGRRGPAVESAIGLFLNTIVIRSDLSGSPTFRELLARVHAQMRAAAAHPDMPFERLVRELQPDRDLSRHPIFQTLLAVNPPEPRLNLADLRVEELTTKMPAAKVDLFLLLQEQVGGSFDALWEYSTDLFDASTVERMHAHFLRLLERVVTDPDCATGRIPLVSNEERARLLSAASGKVVGYPGSALHELVEAQTVRSPDAVATSFAGEEITYAELNRRANQLAWHLQTLGVGLGSLVAVNLERSLELVVALLGILKAGGAYVPLDSELPGERLSFMLADSGAGVLLTQERLLSSLPRYEGTVLCVDRDRRAIESGSTSDLGAAVEGSDLAYVIYTSGSTGKPKGVLNTHAGIVNRLLSMQETYHLDASDRLLQKTPTSFDVSVREVFWPLITGACVVLATPGGHRDPSYLLEVIEDERITITHFVPSMLQLFLEEARPEACQSLRCVLAGGEALPSQVAKQFLERFECELHNLYGPTEAAISVTSWRCDGSLEPSVVPIGRPVANTQVYVVDRNSELVPNGVWGELLIGGVQVARGYHGRPELTAERFVPDPFGSGTVYRTGDLGRWNADGAIEFGGRIDDQVKLRGFRIELGEIEGVLREHEAVADSVVVLTDSASGQPELAAYVVLRDGQASATPDLDSFLRSRLPEYMLPASFTWITKVPLSPTGKVDRSALPAPDRPEQAPERQELVTDTERSVAEVWRDVLGLESVGRDDNFFFLGGHSLLAARLLGRVSSQLGVKVPLRAFFERPTVAGLAARVDGATRSDGELRAQPPPLLPAARSRRCSFAQERFWFLEQMTSGSAAYNIPVPLRLKGRIESALLERALSEVVRRHEILRTRFSVEEGRPVQIVEPAGPVHLPVVDLTALDAAEGERQARHFVDEQTQLPFNVTVGPLFRAHLLHLGPEHHVLHFVFNHLVFDGWSKVVFFRELGTLYAAFAQEAGSPFEERTVQYGDFAEWERSWLEGDVLQAELSYWSKALEGLPDALELPADHARPVVASTGGAWRRSILTQGTVDAVQSLARTEGATTFTTLLAAFAALLYRYTGQEDIAVGTVVDGRSQPEVEEAIGVFINTVVLRVGLSPRLTFRDLLQRVQQNTLDALAHQHLPFDRLVRDLHPHRDPTRHPLFQVLLALDPTEAPLALRGVEVEELETERAAAGVDLALLLEKRGNELLAVWEYSTDLFTGETIDRMQEHFSTLLDAAIADPDRPIAELEMLGGRERTMLLDEWNDTAVEIPAACVHQLIAAQAAASPSATAIEFEDTRLSYRELDERSNRLANHLRALGVRDEQLVAICVERSAEMVVGLLGILKAGAAYVPIDPAFPAERRRFMLDDASVAVIVTEAQLGQELAEYDAELVYLDGDAAAVRSRPADPPPVTYSPDRLAYVIYTSGSTGKPKGVEVEHRALTNLLLSMKERPGLTSGDAFVAVTTLSFDIAALEIFLPLVTGATLVVAPRETTNDPRLLARLLDRSDATVMQATPTTWRMLVDSGWRGRPGMKALCGGEALPAGLSDELIERGLELWNMYGPTETTIWSGVEHIAKLGEAPGLGGPIANTTFYVLDSDRQLVPVGVAGELYIGGAGLARGYRGRADLTAERFVPHPFESTAGERLYRTGDLVRYRPSRALEFLGRIDQQVKVRGFRIELGEVEARLEQHPGVAAAVASTDELRGERRLVAYVVPEGKPPAMADLRGFLEETLPAYMVPSIIATLPRLPLTPNGKVDRNALPPLTSPGTQTESRYAAPRTELEEVVASVWAEVLEVERVGIEDNFFELGGHSLLLARIAAQIRDLVAVDIPLRTLFERPTVEAVAAELDLQLHQTGQLAPTVDEKAEPIRGGTKRDSYSPSVSQLGLLYLYHLQADPSAYNFAVGYRLRGFLDVGALSDALSEVVDRHEALRTNFVFGADEPRCVVRDEWSLALSVVDLSDLAVDQAEAEAKAVLQREARRPFDLASDLLLQPVLVRLAPDHHLLLVRTHHITFDGWSLGILERELDALYAAGRASRPAGLPQPALQYGDFALWQRSYLSGAKLTNELAWWRNQLAGTPPLLDGLYDYSRGSAPGLGASHTVALPETFAAGVRALTREMGVSAYVVLLAAFVAVLSRRTGRDDLVIGTPMANRGRPELEHVVGFCSNTVALRLRPAANPSFRQLVSSTRDVVLDAYSHQELPFPKVVEAVRPQREVGANPLLEVNFRATSDEGPGLRLANLEIERIELEPDLRFDLSFELSVGPDGLRGFLGYDSGLFAADTIAGLVSDFERFLAAALREPDRRLLAFDLGADSGPGGRAAGGIKGFRERGKDMPPRRRLRA